MDFFHVFHTIDLIIQSYVQLAVNQLQSNYVSGIIQLTTISITIYITVYGYMVLAGKIAAPVQDLVWNVARFAFIIAVISNQGNLLSGINEGVDDFKRFLVGPQDIYNQIDQLFSVVTVDCLRVWGKFTDPNAASNMQLVIQLLCYLPLVLALCALGAMMALADIELKILLATAPIFLFCLMWGFLRASFNRWASAIFSNLFLLLFSAVLVKFSILIVRSVHGLADNTISSMMMILVFGVVLLAIIKWSRDMALSLASFSVTAAASGLNKSIERGAQVVDARRGK